MKASLLFAIVVGTVVECSLPDISLLTEEYKVLGFSSSLITKDGEQIRVEGGRRMSADPTPIGPSDRWQSNANTKMITAFVVSRMIAQGLININSTLQEVLDVDVDESYKDVTLRHIVLQMGGLPSTNYLFNAGREFMNGLHQQSNFDPEFDNRPLRHQLAAEFLTKPAQSAIEEYQDGYLGWVIAAHMLEMVSGKTFEQLVQEEVFTPLGMEGCGFGPNTLDTSLPPSQPWSHLAGAFGIYTLPITPGPQSESSSVLVPLNGIYCDMESFGKVLVAHLTTPEDYLSADIWKEIQAQQFYNIGFGIMVDQIEGVGKVGYNIFGFDTQSSNVNYAASYIAFDLGFALQVRVNTNIQDGMRAAAGVGILSQALFEEAMGKRVDLSAFNQIKYL